MDMCRCEDGNGTAGLPKRRDRKGMQERKRLTIHGSTPVRVFLLWVAGWWWGVTGRYATCGRW